MVRLRNRLRLQPNSGFSALQRAENSSIRTAYSSNATVRSVSVLFSEPKIPQSAISDAPSSAALRRFSALQRAENSSIATIEPRRVVISQFQCSSASRKFLNCARPASRQSRVRFQCSSASRKFLNRERCVSSTRS